MNDLRVPLLNIQRAWAQAPLAVTMMAGPYVKPILHLLEKMIERMEAMEKKREENHGD